MTVARRAAAAPQAIRCGASSLDAAAVVAVGRYGVETAPRGDSDKHLASHRYAATDDGPACRTRVCARRRRVPRRRACKKRSKYRGAGYGADCYRGVAARGRMRVTEVTEDAVRK